MPTLIPTTVLSPAFQGLRGLVEFTNEDGELWRYNCGQAAVATVLNFCDTTPTAKQGARTLMKWLEKEHGPDNLFGYLGSSRRRVERGLRARGFRPSTIQGEAALRRTLTRGVPVILSMQLSVGKFWKFDIPSGHWMVAFGFDEEHVYLTNWWDNRITWREFLPGWFGWVPALTCMRGTGIIVRPAHANVAGSH